MIVRGNSKVHLTAKHDILDTNLFGTLARSTSVAIQLLLGKLQRGVDSSIGSWTTWSLAYQGLDLASIEPGALQSSEIEVNGWIAGVSDKTETSAICCW